MNRFILLFNLILCIMLLVFCSCKPIETYYYYDYVNTGIKAEIDTACEEASYHIYDHLIIESKEYSVLTDENLNLMHACDRATVVMPYANFGKEYEYTLYEVDSACDFKVYADSKNRALFCEREYIADFKAYYTDYNNYYFECYFNDDEENVSRLDIEGDKVNELVLNQNYSDKKQITFNRSDVIQLTIVPFSKDNLIEDWQINLLKHNDKIYIADGYTIKTVEAFELSKEQISYFNKFFEMLQ